MSIRLGYYSMDEGEVAWMVMHNNNSDAGEYQGFFADEDAARAYAAAQPDPPEGDYFHPAPAHLNLRIFRVERIFGSPETRETE